MRRLRPDHSSYPRGLRDLASPPDPLFLDGDPDAFQAPAVAIVGTRRMTGYGERVAREIAFACARAGVVVVSGLAQGIDSAAHRGALEGGGRTIAVLGESIDSFVSQTRGRRRPLIPRIREHGALVSEYPAPLSARPWMFAKRNATIAALSTAVVVVEAPAISGALITADDARRLGRALFAVPGPLGSSASVGTNRLIANGVARPLLSASDVVGRTPEAERPTDDVLDLLRDGPLGLDEIARRARLSGAAVTARVAELLLRGDVLGLPDGRLRRA